MLNLFSMRQRTGSITEIQYPGFMKQSLRQCLYLLGKSFDRYGKLKKSGAPDILVDAEKAPDPKTFVVSVQY